MSKDKNPKETSKTSKANKKSTSKSESKDKKNFFKSIAKFFRECKNEIKNTGIVLVVILIIGLFVFGLDTALVNLLGLFMSVAGG